MTMVLNDATEKGLQAFIMCTKMAVFRFQDEIPRLGLGCGWSCKEVFGGVYPFTVSVSLSFSLGDFLHPLTIQIQSSMLFPWVLLQIRRL
jgi:hypothetical protein